MSYSLQTVVAPRKRTPGVSRASPKTHTPASQLQERGFRYYSPEIGRWMSRDPIEEDGDIGLYVFVANAPSELLDALGWVPMSCISGCHPAPDAAPDLLDHLRWTRPGEGGDLGEATWFEHHYPGWVAFARRRYTLDINAWINDHCGQSLFYGPTRRQRIYPYYGDTETLRFSRIHDTEETETSYGDEPQSRISADRILGSFVIDVRTPVAVSYNGSSNNRAYTWQATMYVEDVLGLQPGDPIYNQFTAWLAPSRRVLRATWELSGAGSCCSE